MSAHARMSTLSRPHGAREHHNANLQLVERRHGDIGQWFHNPDRRQNKSSQMARSPHAFSVFRLRLQEPTLECDADHCGLQRTPPVPSTPTRKIKKTGTLAIHMSSSRYAVRTRSKRQRQRPNFGNRRDAYHNPTSADTPPWRPISSGPRVKDGRKVEINECAYRGQSGSRIPGCIEQCH